MGDLKKLGKEIKKDHALAMEHWSTGDYYPRLLATLIFDKKLLTEAVIDQLAGIAHPGLAPDLTVLLDLPPETGLARARNRQDNGDRFEDEALAFFARVRARYLQLAQREPQRFRVIDSSKSFVVVRAQLAVVLEGVL